MHFFKEITKLKIRKVLNQRLPNEFAKSFSNVSILVFRPNLRNIQSFERGQCYKPFRHTFCNRIIDH